MFLQKCEIDVIQNVDKMLLGITVKNVEINAWWEKLQIIKGK